MPELDWRKLYFGKVSSQEVQEAVRDPEWQRLREWLKGRPLAEKYTALENYMYFTRIAARLECNADNSKRMLRMAQVRVTNYVTALSRGGLIEPSDYR